VATPANAQDLATWQAEAAIAAGERRITWRQPSRHEQAIGGTVAEFPVFAGPDAVADQQPDVDRPLIQGGRERGLVGNANLTQQLGGAGLGPAQAA